MTKYIKALFVAFLLVCGFSAQAITLECKNLAHVPVSLAVSYLDLDGKTWIVEGWYNLESGVSAKIDLDSNNNIFYIYGEFVGGQEVTGGQGSVSLPVYYRTFKYIQGQNAAAPDATVSFVRGVATDGVSKITLGPLKQN